jgi:hypothetical protein
MTPYRIKNTEARSPHAMALVPFIDLLTMQVVFRCCCPTSKSSTPRTSPSRSPGGSGGARDVVIMVTTQDIW